MMSKSTSKNKGEAISRAAESASGKIFSEGIFCGD